MGNSLDWKCKRLLFYARYDTYCALVQGMFSTLLLSTQVLNGCPGYDAKVDVILKSACTHVDK